MTRKALFSLMSVVLLTGDLRGQTAYTENSDTQFNLGSYNGTYLSGSGSNVSIGLEFYGRTAGLNGPGSNKWYNSSWKYRQPLVVTSTAALTDYRVLLTIDTASPIAAGRMNAGGYDLRFTTVAVSGNPALLQYYIESGLNSASTRIWVKAATLVPGDNPLYMYFGNPSAAEGSSAAGVFLLGDDFRGVNGDPPDASLWVNTQSANPVSGSVRDLQGNQLRVHYGSQLNLNYYGLRSANPYSFSAGRRYHVDLEARDTGSESWSNITLNPSSYDLDNLLRFSVRHFAAGPQYKLEKVEDTIGTTLVAPVPMFVGWHGVDILISSSSLKLLLDGAEVYSGANNLNFTLPYIYLEGSSSFSALDDFLFDNVYVAPYSAPEPALGSLGTVQGEYYYSGTFTSQAKDTGVNGTRFQNADWSESLLSGTTLYMEMRAHNSNVALATFTSVAKGGAPGVTGRYAQYRLTLNNTDTRYSPALSTITLAYLSPPNAPSGMSGQVLSTGSIQWGWADNSSGQYQEDSVLVFDSSGALKNTLGADAIGWLETGLGANTLYGRYIQAYNAAGSSNSATLYRYTLPVPPNVSCDKSTGTWLNSVFSCLNNVPFGPNGVGYYRHVLITTSSYPNWTGLETKWESGLLQKLPADSGEYYLHLKSYSSDGLGGDAQVYGPFLYDRLNPSITSFTPSSQIWTNQPVSPAVELADTGGSGLKSYKYAWTGITTKPGAWDGTANISPATATATVNVTKNQSGIFYLHVEAADVPGNIYWSYGGPYRIDKDAPTGTLRINNDDITTPQTGVTLSLTYSDSASGVKEVKYRNSPGSFSTAELPTSTRSWDLSALTLGLSSETKTVEYKIYDNAGNFNPSTIGDTIILDPRTILTAGDVTAKAGGLMGEATEYFSAEATLARAPTGAQLQGETINFFFQAGSTRSAVTNSYGLAVTTFPVPATVGPYDYYAWFSSGVIYSASNDTGTVTATLRPTVLTAEDVNTTASAIFTAKATLLNLDKNSVERNIIGSTVTFIFIFDTVSSTKTALTNGLGIATVTFTAPAGAGGYDYSASFDGNATYGARTAGGRVGVGRRVTSLVMPGVSPIASSTFTVQATLMDSTNTVSASTITFVFNGSTKTVLTDILGIATTSFWAPASSGTLQYSAAYDGDAVYAPSSGIGAVIVTRRPVSLVQSGDSQGYVNSPFVAKAVLSDGTTSEKINGKAVKFLFEGSTPSVTTDINGVSSTTFPSGSVVRISTCYYSFDGDEKYGFADSTGAISIVRRPTSLTVADVAVPAVSSFTVVADLKDVSFAPAALSSKTITFSFLGTTQTAVTDALGIASVTYSSDLSTGTREFTAVFAQDDNYLASNDTGTVTINQRAVLLSPIPQYVFANDPIPARADLKDGVTGSGVGGETITFEYNTISSAAVTLSTGALTGRASVSYSGNASSGTYSYYADFAGNVNYPPKHSTGTIQVYQRPVSLSAYPVSIPWGSTFTVTAELKDGAAFLSGKSIRFIFQSSAAYAQTFVGIATRAYVAPSSTGSYTYMADFAGDATYAPNSSTVTVTVLNRVPVLTAMPAIKYVWDQLSFSASLYDGITPLNAKPISFYFQGSIVPNNNTSAGLATAPPGSFGFTISTPGTYEFGASFAGDADYSARSASSTLTVSKRPTRLDASALSVLANSTFTLSATLRDYNWLNTVSSKTITFVYNSISSAAVTDALGVARVVYTAQSSTASYPYTASFVGVGENHYADTSSGENVNVTLRPTILEMSDYAPPLNSTFTASAVLKDFTTGALLSAKNVTFWFLTSSKTVTSTSVGVASTTYVMSQPGNSPIFATFPGDTVYQGTSLTKTVSPSKRDTTLNTSDIPNAVAKDTFTVAAQLKDYVDGYVITGATISFAFTGSTWAWTQTALTDSAGYARVNYLAPVTTGAYSFSASFAGNESFNPNSNAAAVTVGRRTAALVPHDLNSIAATSSFTVTADLMDLGVGIATKTLTFNFRTSTNTGATNAFGVAFATFTAPSSSGTYVYSVSYPGDALYKPVSASANVGVVRKATTLQVLDVPDAVVSYPFTGTAKLRDVELDDWVLSTKTITFTFITTYTLTVNAITDVGVATAALTAPSSTGTYTYTATFAGDGTYGTSQSTGVVTVKRRPVMFSIESNPTEPYTLTVSTFKGTLYDGKVAGLALSSQTVKFYFRVTNTTVTAVTDALGIAFATFYMGISSGSYMYSGTFDGDVSYDPSEYNDQSVKQLLINPRPTSVLANLGNGETTWNYAFWAQSPTVYVFDPLAGNIGVAGLTVSFVVNSSTITGVTLAAPLGQATSSSSFSGTYFEVAGTTPVTARFDGNQTYAPSILPGGTNWAVPQEGKIRTEQAPATFGMAPIIETYPSMETQISATLLDWWNRPYANGKIVGIPVRYRLSTTPCILPACSEPRTWDAGHWGTVDSFNVATATVMSPDAVGDYPLDYYFATTASFVQWNQAETQRVLRVGLRPTAMWPLTDPFVFGAQMPIRIKVKLVSTSQSNIGVAGKPVIITFNGGAPMPSMNTDGQGWVEVLVATGMPVGSYTYTATFAGDTAYNSASLSPAGNVTIQKNTTFLIAEAKTLIPSGNNFTAKATLSVLVGTTQEPAPGRTINFVFTGTSTVNASGVTNAVGIATAAYTSPQPPGNYSYTADLPENANDLASSTSAPVQVVKRNTSLVSVGVSQVYILDNFTSTATLTDLDSPPPILANGVAGQTINFTIPEVGSGPGTTVASPLGQATAVFTSPPTSGNKTYTAAFVTTTLYAGATAPPVTLNVLKRTTVLSAPEPTTPTNTIFTATATLKDNTPMPAGRIPTLMGPGINVPVKFVYNGVTNYGTTNDSGIAIATFTAQSAANDYICDITYEGNVTYASYSLPLTVHVTKRPTVVTGTPIPNQPAGAQFSAQAQLIDTLSGTGINGSTIAFVFVGTASFNGSGWTSGNGQTSAVFTAPLSTGIYTYTACFPTDATYAGYCTGNVNVTVDMASTTLTAYNASVIVLDTLISSAVLKGKISGTGVPGRPISFTYPGVAGCPSVNTSAAGISLCNIIPPATGQHTLDTAFAGDTAFYASTAARTITVGRRDTSVTVNAGLVNVNTLFFTTATLMDIHSTPSPTPVFNKQVNFLFNGEAKNAFTNSLGVATVTYTSPPTGGTYGSTATFADGDAIYVNSSNYANIMVLKMDTSILLTGATVAAMDVFWTSATVTSSTGAFVAFRNVSFVYKGGAPDIKQTDANGKAWTSFNAGLASGLQTLDVAFDGSADPVYNGSTATVKVNVTKRPCFVVPRDITSVVGGVITATATLYDTVTSTPPAPGPLVSFNFSWNSSTFTAGTNIYGTAVYPYTASWVAGTHKLSAWFAGDQTFSSSAVSTATVTATKRPSTVWLADTTAMLDNVFTATATLVNGADDMSGKQVRIVLDGETFYKLTSGGGVALATFTVTSSTGPHRMDAYFDGDLSYFAATPSPSSATVTVLMRPTAFMAPPPVTALADRVFTTTATLKDVYSLPVATRSVDFVFGATTNTVQTDTFGVAHTTFTANVSTGPYSIGVYFNGDLRYAASTTTVALTVTRVPTSITPLSNITVQTLNIFTATATLKDVDSIVLTNPNPVLKFYFQNSTFTTTADGSGVAYSTFTAPLSSGTYYVNAAFDGDIKYGSSTASIMVTVSQRPAAIALNPLSVKAMDLFKATATLTDAADFSVKLATRAVIFDFNWGSDTGAVTNALGVATAAYTSPDFADTYYLTGIFAGDATYASTSTIIPVAVAKRDCFITGVDISTRVMDVFLASATFRDSISSATSSGRNVSFFLQGSSTYSALTNGVGVSTYPYAAADSSGTYSLYAWFGGDTSYNPSAVYRSTLTLTRRGSYLVVGSSASSIINTTFTITASFFDGVSLSTKAAKSVMFYFQGSSFPAVTDGFGVARATYTAGPSSGTYQILASFAGDSSYDVSSATKGINMVRFPTTLAVPPVSVIMNEKLYSTATLTDFNSNLLNGQWVTFYFNSSSFTKQTSLGVVVATYTAVVSSGVYQMPVSYGGDTLYDSTGTVTAVTVNRRPATMAVTPVSVKVMQVFTATATLYDTLQPADKIIGESVKFEFVVGAGTETKTVVTGAGGVATSTFTAPVDAGDYKVVASFVGNSSYSFVSSSGAVTALQRPTSLALPDVSGTIDELFVTTATLRDSDTLETVSTKTITFTFVTASAAVTNALGKAAVAYTAPSSSGPYRIDAAFIGDLSYYPSSSSGTLNVARRPITLSTVSIQGTIDVVFTATVTLTDTLNSNYVPDRAVKFEFGPATVISTSNASGVATSTFSAPSSSGPATLNITFLGDARYVSSSAFVSVMVDRRPTAIQTASVTVRALDVFTATATIMDGINPSAKLSGSTVTFVFGGSTFTALSNVNGIAVSTFAAPPSSGTFQLNVAFAGNGRNAPAASTETVRVLLRASHVTLNPVTINALDVFTATAALVDTLEPGRFISTRAASFVFQNSTFPAVTNGVGVFVSTYPSGVSSGTYAISAYFNGDAIYEGSSATGTVNILPRPIRLYVNNGSGYPLEQYTATATVVDNVSSSALSGLGITFELVGVPSQTVSNAVGVATVSYSPPGSFGDYELKATFDGNGTYGAAVSTGTLTVLRRPTSVASPDSSATALDAFSVTATLFDVRLSSYVAGEEVIFTFNESVTTSVFTDQNGLATAQFDAPANSGTYTCQVNFAGDPVYDISSGSSTVTVVTRPTMIMAPTATANTEKPYVLTVTLIDPARAVGAPGYKVSNRAVRFSVFNPAGIPIDASTGTAITNEIGIASVTMPGPDTPGQYSYAAIFDGDFTYSASSAIAKIKVGLATSMIASSVETYTLKTFDVSVKLNDSSALAVNGRLVRFKFLNFESTGITNASSIKADGSPRAAEEGTAAAVFTAPSSSGAYIFTADFDGDTIYSASNATGTVTVLRRPSAILAYDVNTMAYSSFNAIVVLKDVMIPSQNISEREISFTFGGATIPAVTDYPAGEARARFFAALSSGTYYYTASFAGDETYDASQASGTLTVQLRPTTMISYNVADVLGNSTFTARVQVKDAGDNPIPGLTVDFAFPPYQTGSGETDTSGYAVSSVFTAPVSSGVYPYTASFIGNEQYLGSSAAGTVAVGPRPTIIFLSNISAKTGAPVSLNAQLRDITTQSGIEGKNLTFNFNLLDQQAGTGGMGMSTSTFQAPADTGTYVYTVTYTGDGLTYLGTMSSATVVVANEWTTLTAIEPISLKIREELAVEATLKNSVGVQIGGEPVVLTFFGTSVGNITSGVGRATATFSTLGLPSTGAYNYTATYAGDERYVASSDTVNVVNVRRRDTWLAASNVQSPPNKAFKVQALLTDNVNGSVFAGQAIAGKTIDFEFYFGTYTETRSGVTSALGVSSVSCVAPVSTGTYAFSATFGNGDPIYLGMVSSGVVTVLLDNGSGLVDTALAARDAGAYVNELFTASATLTATGEPLTGKTILFEYFNGVDTYTASGVTDSTGLAAAVFTAPASSGAAFSFIASFIDPDGIFASAWDTGTITAVLYPDVLTARNVTAYIGDSFTAGAVLKDGLTSVALSSRTLEFEFFDGVTTFTVSAVTSSTGSAEAVFATPAVAGNYSYTVRFAGDSLYLANTAVGAVMVASRGSSTFLVAKDVLAGINEVFKTTVTLSSKGFPVPGASVAITFEGVTSTAVTNAYGIAGSTFTAPASTGVYIYSVNFAGNENYTATFSTGAVAVVQRVKAEESPTLVTITTTTVVLAWPRVTTDSTTIKGYSVEKANALRGGWENSEVALIYSTDTAMSYSEPIESGKNTYMRVKTVLLDGQKSSGSVIVEIPDEAVAGVKTANYYYMSDDENAWVKIPGKTMNQIYSSTQSAPLDISVRKESNPEFLLAYNINVSGADSNAVKELKSGNKNGVKLSISYSKLGSGATPSAASGQMALYWYNGVEWIKLGGELDALAGEVYTYSRTFGQFAVKAAPLSSVFKLSTVAPRIFSPDAADQIPVINRVTFGYENPGCGEVTIRIFDITGALVRRNIEAAGCNAMFWNGKDQGGAAVKGGVYIYQIEAGDKVATGTVVVAK